VATDLERLIVTVEANTRQFTRAMNALSGETDRAMRGVESSLSRAGSRIGGAFGNSITRGLISILTIGAFRHALEAAAFQSGNVTAYQYVEGINNFLANAQIKAGNLLSSVIDDAKVTLQDLQRMAEQLGDPFSKYLAETAFGKILNIQHVTQQQIRDFLGKQGGLISNLYKEGPPAIPIPQEKPSLPGMELLKQLESQSAAIGDTARAQEVLNNLRQAGVELDSEWAEKIALTTGKLYDQKQALEAVNQLNDDLASSTETFAKQLLDGASAMDALNAALRQLAEQLLHMAIQGLFNPGGTSLLQTLFGGLINAGPIGGSAGSTASVSNTSLGAGGRMGSSAGPQFNTAINVSGSVDQKTLGAMKGMIERNNVRQNQELQRTWGNRQARYAALRGP
jgi:hypothetical protein